MQTQFYTGKNKKAPELRISHWLDENGQKQTPLFLDDLGTGYKIMFCFQHWCPGCHSHGFPAFKFLIDNLPRERFGFAVIQTVFEGAESNTPERIREAQEKYGLKIPFAHDHVTGDRPTIMQDYNTGGTPWFIVIDPADNVIFSDFRINAKEAVRFLREQNDA